jgi:hypothetical protein
VIIVRVGLESLDPDKLSQSKSEEIRGEKNRKAINPISSSIMPVVKSYRRRISVPAVTKTNSKSIEQEREKGKRKANPKTWNASREIQTSCQSTSQSVTSAAVISQDTARELRPLGKPALVVVVVHNNAR